MAESKTKARGSGAPKTSKGTAKAGKEAAKGAKAPAKTAKPAAGTSKAPAKAAKAPAKAPKAPAKAPKATAKAVKAPAGASKGSAKAAKDAARAAATMAAHWHREGIYDSVPLGVFRGPDAVRRLYQEMFAAMPDMRTTVERITADDRVAAVQWRASGTFSGGPFQGIEPTGRQIEVRGIDSLEVDDGKILRNTSVYDGAAVARGMGLLPAEDSGADRAMRAGFNTVTKLRRVMAERMGGAQ
jgi:steroid delta-isomerase-like uncharacterized protein